MVKSLTIVTDECVDFEVTRCLRNAGYLVFSICETTPSLKDSEVLTLAWESKSLLITEDKDFGELVIRLKLNNYGILLIRMPNASSDEKADAVKSVLDQYQVQLLHAFSVIEKGRFRIRNIEKQKNIE
jgi:predicted nuclease of predicted toxin-antitoxin system